jgi:polyisoprenoid-binding protein YceI
VIARLAALVLAVAGAPAFGAPERYEVDSDHTYPSLEFPHMGISTWRGKFNKTRGHVILDRAARTGEVDILVEAASIDFGHRVMNEAALAPEWLNADMHPNLRYVGTIRFEGDAPAAVDGRLTLLGTTRPVALRIHSLKCIRHPIFRREVCGADASGRIDRGEFGMKQSIGEGSLEVTLRIQVEAMKR